MTNKTYATREQFLAPAKRRFAEVYLPMAEITVRIRSLLESEKEAYESAMLNAKGDIIRSKLVEARRRLISLCLCDENGERILSDADLEAMKELHGADLSILQGECQKLSGFSNSDIEELEKNSVDDHGEN